VGRARLFGAAQWAWPRVVQVPDRSRRRKKSPSWTTATCHRSTRLLGRAGRQATIGPPPEVAKITSRTAIGQVDCRIRV